MGEEEEVIRRLGWVMSAVVMGHLISNGDKKCATGQRCEFVALLRPGLRPNAEGEDFSGMPCSGTRCAWFDPYPLRACVVIERSVYPDHAAHSMCTAFCSWPCCQLYSPPYRISPLRCAPRLCLAFSAGLDHVGGFPGSLLWRYSSAKCGGRVALIRAAGLTAGYILRV